MPVEFICCECLASVVLIDLPDGAKPPEPPLCGTCLHLPGWTRFPELVAIFDPDGTITRGRGLPS